MGRAAIELGDEEFSALMIGELLDVLQELDDLGVLAVRHLPGDEDAEVADVLVQQADDGLAVGLDLLGRRVEVADPVERLLRRRDVVAHRREQDDRHAQPAQVEQVASAPFWPSRHSVLPTKRLRTIHSISSRLSR